MKRKCKLADIEKRKINLLQYKDEIIETINSVVPGKHPEVFHDSFQTDPLDRGEAVRLGRALSKIPGLNDCGKKVTIFRLFDGEVVDDEPAMEEEAPIENTAPKGGHM